ncbi:ABC transporter substrate-binding protein [Brevibacillus panacihumi]|nr:ABC transporter substrate-binding protein [Brevibacillus panacihumi]
MMKWNRNVWYSLTLAVGLFAAGCSPSAPPNSASPPTGEAAQTSEQAQPAANQPVKEQKLIIGRGGDSVTLDAIAATDSESFKVTVNVLETLLNFEPDNTNIRPGLAEKWEIAPDGLTYTFQLRQGIKFHDGTDFNADAVVFNFERWMDKNHPLHGEVSFSYYNDMFGGFKGEEGHIIESVKAIDPHTVEFKLKKPLSPFLNNLAMPAFAIASPAALQKHGLGFKENPVGTGPFVFVEWKRNETITLKKNEQYWQPGVPKLEEAVFKVIPDNTARLTALVSGEIDLMDGLNPDDAESVKGNAELQLLDRPPMNVAYLAFNVEKKPFDNQKVRQAVAYAVDKQGIVDAFYGGSAEPAVNATPPSVWGYNDAIQDRPYDLEKAKQLLAEAGYPNGFKTTLWAMPVPRQYMTEGQKIAEALQQDFAKIGIDAQIVTMEWATYLAKIRQGEQDMYLLGWTGDNGDPDNFLNVLFNPNENRMRYKNKEVQDILVEAASTVDHQKRIDMYKKAQELLFEDAPMIPLAHAKPMMAARAGLSGYVLHPTGSESIAAVEWKE